MGCDYPRARDFARSRGFGSRSTSRRTTPVVQQAPSRSNGDPGNCSIDDDLGGPVNWISCDPIALRTDTLGSKWDGVTTCSCWHVTGESCVCCLVPRELSQYRSAV